MRAANYRSSTLSVLLLFGVVHAGERLRADIACAPTGQDLVYDCSIVLKGRKTGQPMAGAELRLGAAMPSMPMAHAVRTVNAEPGGEPGEYRARIELEMYGEWALQLDISKPARDKIVVKKHFGKTEVSELQ